MMLDHVGEKPLGDQLRNSIKRCMEKPETRTGDLKGTANTSEYTTAVIQNLDP